MNKILERYKTWLGKDYEGFEKYVDKEPIQAIRVNTLKINDTELVKRLTANRVKLEKIGFLKHGYTVIKSGFSLGATPEYLLGYYYIQEAASQYPAELLQPEPGDTILDMAAAPGGKTTQIAAMMQNKGVIVALDTRADRLKPLRNNCARLGVSNVLIYNKDARYATDLGLKFDKVLIDAPCSGNVMSEKDWLSLRSFDDFKAKAKVQKQLLGAAFDVLKDDGEMVYSTCSLETEEDEDVIEWAKDTLGIKVISMKKFWPHIDGTQGFFAAKLSKK